MLIANHQTTFPAGLMLIRYCPSGAAVDTYCGTVGYYQQMLEQLIYDALEYYTPKDAGGWPAGPNKFLKHVFWHIYAPGTPMPLDENGNVRPYEACCHSPNAAGEIHIHLRYYPPGGNWGPYKMPSALSHEMGHAYHYWAGLYTSNAQLAEVERTWERMVSLNRTTFNASYAPWRKADGGVESGQEQAANTYRCLMGVDCTRGVSGPGTTDPVLAGFEDPKSHPEWKKAFQLLPELCGFIRANGARANTLKWVGSTNGWWEFRRGSDGRLIAQDDYYRWYHRDDNGPWVRFYPTYTVA